MQTMEKSCSLRTSVDLDFYASSDFRRGKDRSRDKPTKKPWFALLWEVKILWTQCTSTTLREVLQHCWIRPIVQAILNFAKMERWTASLNTLIIANENLRNKEIGGWEYGKGDHGRCVDGFVTFNMNDYNAESSIWQMYTTAFNQYLT